MPTLEDFPQAIRPFPQTCQHRELFKPLVPSVVRDVKNYLPSKLYKSNVYAKCANTRKLTEIKVMMITAQQNFGQNHTLLDVGIQIDLGFETLAFSLYF